jgi:hypothetical protein
VSPAPVIVDTFNWWTDVVVPFGSALIGGLLAVGGAYLGANRAANVQAEYARLIDRQRRQTEALLELDGPLAQLEYRARANEKAWETSPSSMSSNWNETLIEHLRTITAVWPEVAHRVTDEGVRSEVTRYNAPSKEFEVQTAQERRNSAQDQNSIDEARELNKRLLYETVTLRGLLNEAL